MIGEYGESYFLKVRRLQRKDMGPTAYSSVAQVPMSDLYSLAARPS